MNKEQRKRFKLRRRILRAKYNDGKFWDIEKNVIDPPRQIAKVKFAVLMNLREGRQTLKEYMNSFEEMEGKKNLVKVPKKEDVYYYHDLQQDPLTGELYFPDYNWKYGDCQEKVIDWPDDWFF